MSEHHVGLCHGGPYNGEWWDYHEPFMVVFVMPAVGESGEYEWVGEPGEEEGMWFWHPFRRH